MISKTLRSDPELVPMSNDDQAQKSSGGDADQRFHAGQLIDGRYEIISLLARGGMGVLYRVKHVLLGKELVLKTIAPSSVSASALLRFEREAKTSFSLQHPNIVHVGDYGILNDELPFLTMEFLRGETLSERLKRIGSLPLEEAVGIFIQVCFGLAHAHNHGVVHRDIKPSNLMLISGAATGTEGSVKILDFGIAKLNTHEDGEIQALTRNGELFGSPLYMSPEQCGNGRVDHRSDIYSLGCTLFEALTGAPPFMGDTALTTMLKHQNQVTPTLVDASLGVKFPRVLEGIVAKMLAKDPVDRYDNLGVVAHELATVINSPVPGLELAGREERAERADRKSLSSAFTGTMPPMSWRAMLLIQSCVAVISAVFSALLCFSFWGGAHSINPEPGLRSSEYRDNQVPAAHALDRSTAPAPDSEIDEDSDRPPLTPKLKNWLGLAQKDHHLSAQSVTISNQDLKAIGDANWIQELLMSGSRFDNDGLSPLVKLPELRVLDLSDTNLDDSGMVHLEPISTLTKIALKETKITDASLPTLSKFLKSAKVLNLDGAKLTDASVEKFSSPTLINLGLRSVKGIHDRSLYNLATRFPKLTFLNISYCNITDAGLAKIADSTSLNDLSVTRSALTTDGVRKYLSLIHRPFTLRIYNSRNISEHDLEQLRREFKNVTFRSPEQSREENRPQ